ERLVRADQIFDAPGVTVEALGEPRHLVSAFDLYARGKLAGAQRFDARLQALQARGQPAHDRVGADSDREREQREREEKPVRHMRVTARRARLDPPAVGQAYRPSGATPAVISTVALAVGRGHRLTHCG